MKKFLITLIFICSLSVQAIPVENMESVQIDQIENKDECNCWAILYYCPEQPPLGDCFREYVTCIIECEFQHGV